MSDPHGILAAAQSVVGQSIRAACDRRPCDIGGLIADAQQSVSGAYFEGIAKGRELGSAVGFDEMRELVTAIEAFTVARIAAQLTEQLTPLAERSLAIAKEDDEDGFDLSAAWRRGYAQALLGVTSGNLLRR